MTVKSNKYEGISKLPLSFELDLFLGDRIHEL